MSVRVKNTDATKDWFNKAELTKIFKAMGVNGSDKFKDDIVSHRCFIGQPVVISKEEAVLRIALGSDSLRAFISD